MIGLIPSLAAGQTASVYKWTDGEGIINYGALPPDWADAERTNIRIRGTDRAAVEAQQSQKSVIAEATHIRKRQEAGETEAANKQRKEVAQQAAKSCRQAKERMTRYSEAHRLYRPTPDGEREYLSSEELDSARAEVINSVGQWCDLS